MRPASTPGAAAACGPFLTASGGPTSTPPPSALRAAGSWPPTTAPRPGTASPPPATDRRFRCTCGWRGARGPSAPGRARAASTTWRRGCPRRPCASSRAPATPFTTLRPAPSSPRSSPSSTRQPASPAAELRAAAAALRRTAPRRVGLLTAPLACGLSRGPRRITAFAVVGCLSAMADDFITSQSTLEFLGSGCCSRALRHPPALTAPALGGGTSVHGGLDTQRPQSQAPLCSRRASTQTWTRAALPPPRALPARKRPYTRAAHTHGTHTHTAEQRQRPHHQQVL